MSELVVLASQWSLVSDRSYQWSLVGPGPPVLLMTFTLLSQSPRWLAGCCLGLGRNFSKYLH